VKVFVLGSVYPDSFAKNVVVTLRNMGHTVSYPLTVSMNLRSISRMKLLRIVSYVYPPFEERSQHRAIQQIIDEKPDIVIQAGMQEVIPAVWSDMKKRTGAMLVAWFPDCVANFGRQYVFASPFDAYFTKEPYLAEILRNKLCKRAFILPEACNPMWHHRVSLTEAEKKQYGCDLTLAGNMHYYRALILEQLMDFDIKMWGVNCPRWLCSPAVNCYQNHHVAECEKAKAFNAAKIVLNAMHYAEIQGVNCRTFEAAGCGAFQIVDHKPALAGYFKPDEEIVTFQTIPELREKVRYYLDHGRERQEIADRAYRRAHSEHTYEVRLKEMFDICQRL